MKSTRRLGIGLVGCLTVTALLIPTGCDSGSFLGLADYPRDLLFSGIASAILANRPADAGTTTEVVGQPLPGGQGPQGPQGPPGPPGADGTDGADGATGPAGPVGPQGPAGPDGADGPAGEPGPAGPAGASGGSGPAGPNGATLFETFIDDFFRLAAGTDGSLVVVDGGPQAQVVAIREPVLSSDPTTSAIGYRVSIPDMYDPGNDVTMRLFLHRTGPVDGSCFIFTVDGRRLRDGQDIEVYGDTRWVRLDTSVPVPAGGNSDVFLVVDLPINSAAGLGYPNDLADADALAFELATLVGDGGDYHLLGVGFFESEAGAAALVGATVIATQEEACCVNNEPLIGPLVYVSNTGSDQVWVVDTATEAVVAVVDVGNDPRGIDITPDNSRVYVANRFDGSVSVIDTATLSLTQTIDLSGSGIVTATEPYDVVISPDGAWLYVAMKNGGSENGDGTVVVVDLPAGTVVAEAVLDGNASLEGIVVTPDGQKVYAAGRGNMYIVDVSAPATPVFLGTSGNASRELVVSPSGEWVYANNNAVRTSDDVAVATGAFSGGRGIDISPDERFLYSTSEG
ncbi:MAG: beta-propeller fold lactonase family protein, partial [Phycisphaerae bacterium]